MAEPIRSEWLATGPRAALVGAALVATGSCRGRAASPVRPAAAGRCACRRRAWRAACPIADAWRDAARYESTSCAPDANPASGRSRRRSGRRSCATTAWKKCRPTNTSSTTSSRRSWAGPATAAICGRNGTARASGMPASRTNWNSCCPQLVCRGQVDLATAQRDIAAQLDCRVQEILPHRSAGRDARRRLRRMTTECRRSSRSSPRRVDRARPW